LLDADVLFLLSKLSLLFPYVLPMWIFVMFLMVDVCALQDMGSWFFVHSADDLARNTFSTARLPSVCCGLGVWRISVVSPSLHIDLITSTATHLTGILKKPVSNLC
jgi:hypothetical protein